MTTYVREAARPFLGEFYNERSNTATLLPRDIFPREFFQELFEEVGRALGREVSLFRFNLSML